MTIKVLIIDPDIQFTVPIKKALESSGDFTVDVYTTGQAGLESVQRDSYDIAILDFGIDDMTLPELIHAIRQEHADLFVLVSPRTDEHIMQLSALDVQGSITKPYFARQLGPVIREAITAKVRLVRKGQERRLGAKEARPVAKPAPLIEEPPITPDDTFTRLTQNIRVGETGKSQPAQAIIEEPEIPEGATIRDLVSGQSTPAKPAAPDSLPESEAVADLEPTPVLAMMALGAAGDDTVPLDQLAIPNFLSHIEQTSGDQPLRAVPLWVQHRPDDEQHTLVEPAVRYDDTQPSEKIRIDLLRASVGDTQPGGGVVQEKLENDQQGKPPAKPPLPPRPLPELLDEPGFLASVIAETPKPLEPVLPTSIPAIPPTTPTLPAADHAISAVEPESVPVAEANTSVMSARSQDHAAPESAAKIAVQLTQLTVESTAQATLLTHDNTLIASAGDLSARAIAGIVESILVAWQGASEASGALIRYIHVPGIGDFLLYSTQTIESMTLSMLFPGETPLRVIRRQAKQLADALDSVPDIPTPPPAESEAATTLPSRPTDLRAPEGLRSAVQTAEVEPEAVSSAVVPELEPAAPPALPRAEGPYTAYAFVWLPRIETLETHTAEIVPEWLHMIAAEHAWQVDGVEVQPSYVAVQVNIPANETPTATVETLMRETAARSEDYALWADAYYIVAPGRAVTQQEIANFMEYRRGAQDAA